SVSLSGDTAVVSAIFDDIESGVAYIFVRDDSGNWNRQAKLRGQEDFGSAISVDGDIAVFNSPFRPDAVRVFARDGVGNWIENIRLSPDSDDQEEEFGTFLSIDGNTIVVRGVSDNGNGATYVFELQRPDGFVFLADEKVEIDRPSISAGNIHANGDIIFDKGSRGTHTGDLSAVDFIKIGKRNTIVGDASAGFSVIIDDKSTVTGTVVENTDVAVIPLPTITPFSAGKEDIKVKSGEILALAPGSYDDVRANEGATLQLMSGEYFLEELDLKDRSVLEIDVSKGSVTINVEKELEFDNEMEVRITPFDEDSSNWVTFKQLGHKTVEIDKGAKVLGTIIAPKAKVELKTGSYFKGTILARTIEVKTRVTFLPHNSSDSE
ncbi:MAG: FG-GAP repeat protein, partial [Methylococcales bacterium]